MRDDLFKGGSLHRDERRVLRQCNGRDWRSAASIARARLASRIRQAIRPAVHGEIGSAASSGSAVCVRAAVNSDWSTEECRLADRVAALLESGVSAVDVMTRAARATALVHCEAIVLQVEFEAAAHKVSANDRCVRRATQTFRAVAEDPAFIDTLARGEHIAMPKKRPIDYDEDLRKDAPA